MRGSIWAVVAVGAGAALTPAILDVDVAGDATGQATRGLLGSVDVLVGLAFAVVVFGLLISFAYTDSGF